MEVVCTGKKIIIFFIYSHDKFLALSLLNPLEKNPGVTTSRRGSHLVFSSQISCVLAMKAYLQCLLTTFAVIWFVYTTEFHHRSNAWRCDLMGIFIDSHATVETRAYKFFVYLWRLCISHSEASYSQQQEVPC